MTWQRTIHKGRRKDLAALLGRELRTIYSASQLPPESESFQSVLRQIEVRRTIKK
ncbi:MAG TPA: hypothetical protein VKV77_05980 [Methylovirgula sp.]|nr:hypothetical protein [Methylovirgula sp.]